MLPLEQFARLITCLPCLTTVSAALFSLLPTLYAAEEQCYTARPENLRVENGRLVIEARREQYTGSAQVSMCECSTL
jgi:hypothetical protein